MEPQGGQGGPGAHQGSRALGVGQAATCWHFLQLALGRCPALPHTAALPPSSPLSPQPRWVCRTVAELEAAIDACRLLHPTIVHAPKTFNDDDVRAGRRGGCVAGCCGACGGFLFSVLSPPHPHPLSQTEFMAAKAEGRLSKKRGVEGGLAGGLKGELELAQLAEVADAQV